MDAQLAGHPIDRIQINGEEDFYIIDVSHRGIGKTFRMSKDIWSLDEVRGKAISTLRSLSDTN